VAADYPPRLDDYAQRIHGRGIKYGNTIGKNEDTVAGKCFPL
jgi:hypothetical protein